MKNNGKPISEEMKHRELDLELFDSVVRHLSEKLRINFATPYHCMVIQDILARTYLNELNDCGLIVDPIPLFYLELPPSIPEIEKISLPFPTVEINQYTYDYISSYFIMGIENFKEELNNLSKVFTRYKKEFIVTQEDVWFITKHMENKLVRDRPDWWKILDATRIRLQITEPLLMATLGPKIGDTLTVFRPYTLYSRKNRWQIEKTPVFQYSAVKNNGPFYFDYAKIKITHKCIGGHGAISIIAKDEDGDNFVCDIPSDEDPEKVICCWRVFVNMGIGERSYSEETTFIEIKDFESVNNLVGNPLTEFKLKTLIDDASMRLNG